MPERFGDEWIRQGPHYLITLIQLMGRCHYPLRARAASGCCFETAPLRGACGILLFGPPARKEDASLEDSPLSLR